MLVIACPLRTFRLSILFGLCSQGLPYAVKQVFDVHEDNPLLEGIRFDPFTRSFIRGFIRIDVEAIILGDANIS